MILFALVSVCKIHHILFCSSAQGAQNIIFAVMEDKSKLENGGALTEMICLCTLLSFPHSPCISFVIQGMYADGKIWEGVKMLDELGDDVQKELWGLSEELIKEK